MISGYANAQDGLEAIKRRMIDSIKDMRIDEAALMYPRIRQFSITHQENMAGTIYSKKEGQDFFKAKFKSSRTTINFNLPVIYNEKNSFVASLGVVHQFYSLRDVDNYSPGQTVSDMNTYIPMVSAGLTYSRRDSLFHRPVTFTASLNGLFNPSMSRRQFTFTGLITVPILHTENSNLIGGVVVSIDPSSPAPAFLFVSYFHKFRAADLDLMIDLPYRVALRKPILKRASITAFGELAGTNSFFTFDNTNGVLPQDLTYSTLEIKSGLLFEYRLTRKAVFGLSGGFNSTVTSKIMEKGESPSNYFIKNSNSTVPYLQVGLSLLPFWKPFNH